MAVSDNSTGSGDSSGNIFTSRTSILDQKLYVIIIASVVVVLIIFLIILLFLRLNRNAKRRRIALKHSSGLLPFFCKEIDEIKDSDRTESRKAIELENKNITFLVEDVVKGVAIGKKGSSESNESNSNRSESSSAVSASTDGMNNFGWGRLYSLKELEIATDQFSDENVIGEGGYGIVYRGILHDGSVVAVKSLRNNKGQAEKEFKVEVEAIGKVRHKNLVGLIGFCAEGTQRLLVYEYIDNGNLEQWLHGDVGLVSPLTWEIRMKIAIGTARGLAYLHEGLEPKVVHRDVKSSNILP
ncbi:putative receptor-like serine/threonine-protein kinase [Abeliophyllum distichum]|uniref:non-specific serine/threonine protein kinase n=1 Tax=Abeliophyllum distichum TaxID=126358 RepID=A0ABD1THN7_9LAMI